MTPRGRAVAVFAERVISTGLVVFVTVVGQHGSWTVAFDQGAFAALAALITSLVALKLALHNPRLDFAWRVMTTFLQALAAQMALDVVAPSVLHFAWGSALRIAVLAAALSAVKALAGLVNPHTVGASPVVRSG